MNFTGKTALVTGSGRGIGRAIAHSLALYGADVIVADINEQDIAIVNQEVEKLGQTARAIHLDVTNQTSVDNAVAQSIEEQATQAGMDEIIDQVMVPIEEVVEMRHGAKVNADRKFFPGYVLVRMDLTDESWHLVKNTPKVTDFLGGKGRGRRRGRRGGRVDPTAAGDVLRFNVCFVCYVALTVLCFHTKALAVL